MSPRVWKIPPGEIVLEEFLKPMEISQVDAARRLGISLNRLNEIVIGKRGITADTALRLAKLLKTSPQFWMRLQADWDLHHSATKRRDPAVTLVVVPIRSSIVPVLRNKSRRPFETVVVV